MCKYLERRKAKARLLVDQVRLMGAHEYDGKVIVSGSVLSSGGGSYHVSVVLESGRLVQGACECPDEGAALRGRRVCKHRIALAMRWNRDVALLALVMYLTGWEWIIEFGGGAWVHESH